MAAFSEEAPRKIPSRERTAAQMPLVFRGVPLPCASKDYLGLLSQGEASIAFCQASAHCDGSGSLSPRRRKHRPFAPTDRRGWPRNVSFPGSLRPARIDRPSGSRPHGRIVALSLKCRRPKAPPNGAPGENLGFAGSNLVLAWDRFVWAILTPTLVGSASHHIPIPSNPYIW